MKRFTLLIYIQLLFIIAVQAQTPQLFINEFLASNQTDLTDEVGEFEDWVEIYNAGSSAVDMGGMYFTDDLGAPTTWQIPTTDPAATTVPAGGFLVFFFDKDIDQGVLHVNAKLRASGEAIGLYASDGVTEIDSYAFGAQLADVSKGRTPDGGSEWAFFTNTTPNETNDTPTGTGITEIPVANLDGGFYNNSITLTLSSATPGADIYYTTDGSDPTDNSEEYNGPIDIDDITVVRAIATAAGLEDSPMMTHTYLIDVDHDFVVVTMSTDPDNLFDLSDGLFPNYEEELEKPAHIQFFEPDGTLAFSQNIEIELHGLGSLSLPQKSLKMKAKASLGNSHFDYPIFPQRDIDKYRSFIMRQSGQDWNRTMFRDAMMQGFMDDVSDLGGIIERPDLDLQAFRPAILYINGEYWGIQNVREQMSWKYIDAHYGIGKDDLDVTEDENELKTGDLVEWDVFMDFLDDNNFSGDAFYQSLREKADVDHYMDYILHGIIMDNNDWPGNNNRHWRERTPDGKWRWLSKDFDFGFGLRPINSTWDSGDFTTDMLSICLAENSSEYYNRPPATLFLRRLMENDDAKTQFINRAADLLNTVFEKDRMNGRIDSLEDLYIPEMQQHYDIWQSGWNGHSIRVAKLRIFADGRTSEVRNHFQNYFSEVTGQSDVTIDAYPENGGTVQFNTLNISESFFPWEGIYFRGLEVPAVAIPAPGYFFDDWSGAASGSNPEILVDINSSSESLTANFTLGSTATDPIVINEINYNSPDSPDPADWVELYNPNNFAVDISGWYFEDESGEYYGFPANTIMQAEEYFILAEDAAQFSSIYPSVGNVFGSFGDGPDGFGLSGKGEKITLKNANGTLIDEVDFDDNLPWPEEPDGNGPTLQLIQPSLDNALPGSWTGIPATPGEVNGGGISITCPGDIEVFVVPGTAGEVVSWTINQPVTTCPIGAATLTQTAGLNSGSFFPVGTTTVSYEASDPCENVASCSFDVTVTEDAGTLTVICPPSLSFSAEPGASSKIVNWAPPTASTTCAVGDATLVQVGGPTSGSDLTIGTYLITYAATDECGNGLDCSFEITVNGISPTLNLNCPTTIVVSSETGQGEVVTWNEPTADTDCTFGGIISLTQSAGLPSGSFFPVGNYTVSYVAIDACGIVANCTFEISVTDGTSTISLDCPEDINIVLPVGVSSTEVNWATPTVSTTCGGGTANLNCGTTLPGLTFVGTYEDHEYYVSSDKVQWTTAQASAEAVGAYLAVINDGAENDFIENNVGVKAFIGLNDADTEGSLEWINGDPVGFTNFVSSPVNNELNDYVYYQPWDGRWNWYPGSIHKYYLVELECAGGSGLQLAQTGGPTSGEDLTPGTYNITYEASDNCDGLVLCSFSITIENNPASLFIDCPEDITVTANLGANGENVVWADATAYSFNCTGPVNVNQTQGLASGSFFTIGNHIITYEATDGCSNIETCSFTITVLPNVPSVDYCDSAGSLPWSEHINNVTFGSINNISGKDGYGDYTGQSTTVLAGNTYPISILPKFSWTQHEEYIRVWIDFNLDNDFTDAGELVFAEVRPGGVGGSIVLSVTGNINIPADASSGATRMRVSMKRGAYAGPCEVFQYGEVEDYTVNLTGNGPGENFGGNGAIRNDSEANAFENAFKVYPNPASELLTVDLSAYTAVPDYFVMYNAQGQAMLQKVINADEQITINVESLSRGLYLIMVVDKDGERLARQVIVNH